MVKGRAAQRRKAVDLAFLSTIENEAYGPMAKATASVVEKFMLFLQPFTTTQIPTAMNAPPAM